MTMLNRWLLTLLAVLVAALAVGLAVPDKFGGAIAVYTFLLVGLFFGTFGLLWGASILDASVNDWVAGIRRMEVFSEHYWTWLYENRRRQWAAEVTLFALGLAVVIGAFLCSGTLSHELSFVGFVTAVLLLMTVALCWYKGFWKPRTEAPAPRVPQSVEAEWRDKRL
jgi:hypothetical protein